MPVWGRHDSRGTPRAHASPRHRRRPGRAHRLRPSHRVRAAPASAAVSDQIRINEVSSDPDDWIELTNTGSSAVDISGWLLSDNARLTDATHLQSIAAGTDSPAGRLREARLHRGRIRQGRRGQPLPAGLRDPRRHHHVAGRRPRDHMGPLRRRAGAFQATTPTPAAANVCTVTPGPTPTPTPAPALDPNWDDIEINEIASLNDDDEGNPGFGDAVELVNTGSHDVTIEGWYQTDSGAATGASPLALADLKVWDGDSFEPAALVDHPRRRLRRLQLEEGPLRRGRRRQALRPRCRCGRPPARRPAGVRRRRRRRLGHVRVRRARVRRVPRRLRRLLARHREQLRTGQHLVVRDEVAAPRHGGRAQRGLQRRRQGRAAQHRCGDGRHLGLGAGRLRRRGGAHRPRRHHARGRRLLRRATTSSASTAPTRSPSAGPSTAPA